MQELSQVARKISNFLACPVEIPPKALGSWRPISELEYNSLAAFDSLALGMTVARLTAGFPESVMHAWLVKAAAKASGDTVTHWHDERQAKIRNTTREGTFQKALVLSYDRAKSLVIIEIQKH
ncbi:MAG: hypothetical protein U9M98_00005 [Patescibacteria group bacterium]|nr:hypothetical protein [Patescibacteria group bacterium]